jgi:PPP family 3-phenylpropionic acid transporter
MGTSLLPLLALYATLYGAYGAQSPFLSPFLAERGATPEALGIILGLAAATRIAAGPLVGHLADRFHARRLAIGLTAAGTGLLSFAYLPAYGTAALLAVVLTQAVAVAALPPVADAVGLHAARSQGFPYGWLRGTGSAAFIAMTLVTGWLVAGWGLEGAMALGGVLFLACGLVPLLLPKGGGVASTPVSLADLRALLADARFRRVVGFAALVTGSHAVNETFAMIRWAEAGLGSGLSSALWSTAVAAEVLMFLAVGPALLDRIGARRALALAACAGVLRWALMASTTSVPLLFVAQAGHGFTFALLHLAAMRVIGTIVPDTLSATAQTLYGTFGLGIANAALTLVSGFLFGWLGGTAYWPMAGLCLLALVLLRRPFTEERG